MMKRQQRTFPGKIHRHEDTNDRRELLKAESADSASISPNSTLGLPCTLGNRAVQRLLAGDKAMQQTEAGTEVSPERSSPTISQGAPGHLQRFTSLGAFEVKYRIYDSKLFPLKVGTTEEWVKRLENMDEEDEYTEHLAAFLWLSRDPMLLKKGHHRLGDKFLQMPSRAPTDEEKMAFVRALYTTGKKLDLPDKFGITDDDEGGLYVFDLRAGLATLIQEYGGRVIAESGNRSMNRVGVTELASEGGEETRRAMIESAMATAYKGVDLYVTALTVLDDRQREIEKMRASETIRNSGRVINITLKQHDAAFKARQEWQATWLGRVFDQLWALVPGGGLISGTAKSLLGDGFKKSFTELPKSSDPSEQVDVMADNFVNQVNQLVLTASDANAIINGFESVRD
jgi:hypothetical protein